MKKRRTKKQKLEAKHNFTLTWNSSETEAARHAVNRQKVGGSEADSGYLASSKNAQSLAQEGNLNSVKREIIKCLGLASFILSLELVIYLVSK